MSRDPTEPTKCSSCKQDVLWVLWPKSGKWMLVDAVPDHRPPPRGGDIVLTLSGTKLKAEKYDPRFHDGTRNRYTNHFRTCPNAAQHRRSR